MKENKLKGPSAHTDEGGADQRSSSAKKKSSRLPRALIGVLNGSFLARENVLRNMPFILFVAGLMLCYIAYGYWTERTVRALDRTNMELKEMRAEYITVRSLLDKKEQQSEVAEDIQGMGLKQSRVPPNRITVDQDLIEHHER